MYVSLKAAFGVLLQKRHAPKNDEHVFQQLWLIIVAFFDGLDPNMDHFGGSPKWFIFGSKLSKNVTKMSHSHSEDTFISF